MSELTKGTHSPVRILFIEHFGHGGLIHYAHCLCQALAEHGVQVSLLTAKDYELAGRPRSFRLLNHLPMWNPYAGSENRRKGISRRLEQAGKGLRYVITLCFVLFTIWKERPDIVHMSELKFLPDLFIFLLRGRPKITYTCHNVQRFSDHTSGNLVRANWLWHYAQTWMYRLCSGVIFHAEENVRDFYKIFGFLPAKHIVIPHGEYGFFAPDQSVSTSGAKQALGLDETKKIILFFGAIRRYKGLDVLLEAVASLRKSVPDIQLVVAGAPGRDVNIETLYNQANQLGLDESVVWHIKYILHEEVHLYFYASDVVVLPHRKAYDSGVLKISQALGRPVIVTNIGGLAAAVEGGKAGLIVPPEDPQAMTQALKELLTDTSQAQMLAKRGQTLAHTAFSWTQIAKQTEKFYRELQGLPCAY